MADLEAQDTATQTKVETAVFHEVALGITRNSALPTITCASVVNQ